MKPKIPQKLFIFSIITKSEKYKELIRSLKIKIQPLLDRWVRFTPREKQLVLAIFIAGGLFVLVSILGSATDIIRIAHRDYIRMQNYNLTAVALNKEYKELSLTSANTFSTVSLTRIQDDVSQVLEIKTPDVSLQEGLLTIKCDNVLFSSVILLLEQFRKSYGIFPNKLTITQSRSGYVALKVTFLVSQ